MNETARHLRVLRDLRNGFLRTPVQLDALEAAVRALENTSPMQGVFQLDPTLCRFYEVETVEQLLAAQEAHILKLQETVRHNVKPWEDTFPPTLLPKYLRDTGLAGAEVDDAMVDRALAAFYGNSDWTRQLQQDAMRRALVAANCSPAGSAGERVVIHTGKASTHPGEGSQDGAK